MKMKRYFMNSSLLYTVLAMVFGVFYREFTKFNSFMAPTKLSFIHPHYFVLGMVFFLMLLILEKQFSFSTEKTKKILVAYHVGLNIAVAGFLARGIMQVWDIVPSKALDASLSGIAGIGHVLLGVSMILISLQIRKSVAE